MQPFRIRSILAKIAPNPAISPSSALPSVLEGKLGKKLRAAGFRNVEEIIRVFDFEPRYFLTIPGIGNKALSVIAQMIRRPNPLPLNMDFLRLFVTRQQDGQPRGIQSPLAPIRASHENQHWCLFDVETGDISQVILHPQGYTQV